MLLERAIGGLSVTVGGFVSTVKATGALLPGGFPSELAWVATAVYVCFPLARLGLALPDVQLPPDGAAVALETSEFDAS